MGLLLISINLFKKFKKYTMNIQKIQDIIIAGAIGDAYGYAVEFDSIHQIRMKYGFEGIKLSHMHRYVVSDDTQMTLFCLEALLPYLVNTINYEDLESINEAIYIKYLNWFNTQHKNNKPKDTFKFLLYGEKNRTLMDFKELYIPQAPGKTCLSALGSNRKGIIDRPINDSKGCGGIMRVMPIALLDTTVENVFHLGCMQAAITHGHPDGYLSSGFFAGMIKCSLQNISFDKAYEINKNILEKYSYNSSMLQYLNKYEQTLFQPLMSPEIMNTTIGEGWVGEEALGIALYAFKMSQNFEQCLSVATNHSGDSDSTASLAGQLYAAFHNLDPSYHNYVALIDIQPALQFILKKLINS